MTSILESILDAAYVVKPSLNAFATQPKVVLEDLKNFSPAAALNVRRAVTKAFKKAGVRNCTITSTKQNDESSFELAASRLLNDRIRHGLDSDLFESSGFTLETDQRTIQTPHTVIHSSDGTPLNVYSEEQSERPVVLLISACGMPALLTRKWMKELAQEFFVVSWESRGLFYSPTDIETFRFGLADQVEDAVAVLNHFNVSRCHVMGFCGGAVIAMKLIARMPSIARSVSLWHGDYNFNEGCPKTRHQSDMQLLMSAVSQSFSAATSYHKLMCRPAVLDTIPMEVAPLVLYPYVNPSLFYLYSKTNGEIMNADVPALVNHLKHRTMIVTSMDDQTAHPDGSRMLAQKICDPILIEEPHGDHITLFDAPANLTAMARKFIREN